ncbi:hypothetical protein [Absidia glauca]|uniref:C2H2-type domain-containing protein n=1 Tax=Absidia glauca TaxID=4829 RepID=A0A168QFP8_ABSGL|nr:hypothetical protein [Absidia glauca]
MDILLSSPPNHQGKHQFNSAFHQLKYDDAKPALISNPCEWAHTPPATPMTPNDQMQQSMMAQLPLNQQHSFLLTSPPFSNMDNTHMVQPASTKSDNCSARGLLAHADDHEWHVYADSSTGLELHYPKSSNQSSIDSCVTPSPLQHNNSNERHPLATFYGMTDYHQDASSLPAASDTSPPLCDTIAETSPLVSSCTSSVIEDTFFSDGDQDTLSTASSLFGHLSKAQLIERVVQLEQEKRRTTLTASEHTVTQVEPKRKHSQEDSTGQEQDIHICRWVNCRTETATLDELITHLRDTHIGSGKASYHCEWIGCARNRKPFMKRHKMHNHLRTHTGERPFVCTVTGCEKRFSRPDSLNTHIRTHSNIRPYLCRVEGCSKAYFHSRSLRKHVKGHEAAGVFVPRAPARQAAINKKKHHHTTPRSTLTSSSPSPEQRTQSSIVIPLSSSNSPFTPSTTFPSSIHLSSPSFGLSPSFSYPTSSFASSHTPSPSTSTSYDSHTDPIVLNSGSIPSFSSYAYALSHDLSYQDNHLSYVD